MSLAHPTKDRWNHRDWLRICDCYSYCLQHGIRITECRIIILELLLQITREPRSYINCSKSKLLSRNHLCVLEWFQVEIHRNVQTSGSKIIKNIVQMLYFHWKSFLKNCKNCKNTYTSMCHSHIHCGLFSETGLHLSKNLGFFHYFNF